MRERRGGRRGARGVVWSAVVMVMVATGLPSPLTALGPAVPSAGPTPAVPAPARVRIVDVPADPGAVPPIEAALRFEPSTVVLVPGQTVVIENASNAQQEVEASDGSFDSGPIDPGGAFVAAVDDEGSLPFATTGTPRATGRLLFGLAALPGGSGDLARSAIPSLAPPATDPADISPHPVYGYPTSRTQLLLLPSSTATVGQVNAALAAAGAVIIGGFDRLELLTVAVPDTGDHKGVLDAMASLGASPAFALRQTLGAGGAPIEDSIAPGSGVVAPVWQGDVETVPPPFLPDPQDLNWIFAPSAIGRNRGDWGLVASRAPAAWNTLDRARINVATGNGSVDTVVLDAGFLANHPDLDFANVEQTRVDEHGTHVAGIIGARFANEVPSLPDRSVGTAGINPVAILNGVEFSGSALEQDDTDSFAQSRVYTVSDYVGAFERVFDGKRVGGPYPSLGVINASFGVAVFGEKAATQWVKALRGKRCGPGVSDDSDPTAATELCLPSNQDAFRSDFSRISGAFGARVLLEADEIDVAIVKSGGNDRHSFCADADSELVWCGSDDADVPIELAAIATNQMIRARQHLRNGDSNITIPLLVVGAAAAGGGEAFFSQRGVDLVAPGSGIRSTYIPDPPREPDDELFPVRGAFGEWYGELGGTSMAAPYVTGAVGYLMALEPLLTAQEAVDLVLSSAVARSVTPGVTCSSGGASVACPPRLDLYGAVLRAAGIRTVADVNDWTPDGNRRVVRTADGATASDTLGTTNLDGDADLGRQRSQPDGTVDLRDVRAFRDAWLHACTDGSLPDAGGAIGCPLPGAITLDGALSNPKRDGNGDGCVTLTAPCAIGEARYSRFDLNGDGILGLNTAAPVFVDANGAVAASPSQLTDWDVLSLALDNQPSIDGWSRGAITGASILYSGDVTVDLGQVQPGISDLKVFAKTSERTVEVPVTVGPNGPTSPVVVTAELNDGGSPVDVWYTGTRNGAPVVSGTVTTAPLHFGEDTTVALCEAGLRTSGPSLLAFNQAGQISVSVGSCTPGAVPQTLPGPVSFTFTPVDPTSVPSPPTLLSSTEPFDESGTARVTVAAGTSAGLYKLTATAAATEGPGGQVVKVEKLIRVVPRLEVRYRWEAEVTSVDVTTSSDWPDVVAGRPDCREVPDPDGCILNARATLTAGAPTPTVTREGTITLDGNGVTLDESVGGRGGSLSIAYGWEDLTTSTSSDGSRTFTFGPLPGQSVTDRPVPLDLTLDADGSILLDGFRFLADIPYESGVVNGATTGPDIQPERFGVPGELLPLSVPQATSVQHSANPTDVTRLRASSGGFVPVSWCGTVSTPIARTPGYRVATQNDLIQGAVVLANDPVYATGKVPMPAGTGTYQRRIRVTFTGAQSGPAADPVLPACTGPASPTAAFDVAPQPDGVLHEGDAIRFLDRSTDPDGDLASWSWSFGRSDRNPVLVPGLDDGAQEVSLRVADTGGRFNRVFQTLNVANVMPTVTPVSPLVTVQEGERATIAVRLDDPGPDDRTKLVVRVAEGADELLRGATYPAGTVELTLPVLAPGAHTVSLYVYDGNRQYVEVRRDVTVAVVRDEVPPPPGPQERAVQSPSCAGPVPLSTDEAALLQRWNAAREQAELPALGLSAELSSAASALAGQSLGVLGLAPTADVGKAADDAGYAGLDVRALPFSRDLDPADVLEGLRASEPSTIFTASGRLVGVAKRAEGSNVKWVVMIGDRVDCDVADVQAGSAPEVTVAPPAGPVVEGARVELAVNATDLDGDIAEVSVDWGDGTVGGTAHRYRDDGVYDVQVRALDEQGNLTLAPPVRLTVTGAAPDVDVVIGELVAGAAATIEVAAADPAEGDRPLQLHVESVPAGAVSFTGIIDGGRTLRVVPPAGSTQLDLTVQVTDDDGQTTVRSFPALPVAAAPGAPPTAPPNVVAPPTPACPNGTAGVTLRSQAADFVTGANALRVSFGAPELVVSKELQAAAEQHLADLVANRYFAHIDAAGKTPLDRARANGYTGGVGENIALRFVNGAQVLVGWRSSPVHLENLLDPVWTATGVAVGNSPTGVIWVQVFGTAPTCPTADRTSIPAPVVLANPPIDASAPVASWPARTTAPAPATSPLPQAEPAPQQAAPQQAPTPSADASVTAFTISDLDPSSGATVTVTNRSRVDGTPVTATLTFGSVTGRSIAPDASFSRAVFSTQDVSLAAAGVTATITVSGTGSYAPQVTILGPANDSSFDQGAAVPVQVLVTDGAATPTPLAGVRVRARVDPPGSDYVIGATGADGKATLTVRPTVAGPVVLEVQAETVGADTWVASTGRNLTIVANTAPVFPAIEPLTVELQQPLRLWVPEAVDADVPVGYSWDLDGNGTFGDLGITSRDTAVSWADVSAVICGGVCTADQAEAVTIRATDAKGATTDAAVTVTPVRDFQVAVNPQRLSLPPGGSTVVAVTVVTRSGFGLPVTLSASGLPAGISADISPATINPGDIANLTLSVSPSYNSTAPIPLAITGTATDPVRGTITRTATPNVNVLIGLDRICTVSWGGTIRNAVTKAPVAGASVQVQGVGTVTAGPDGRWSIPVVPVAGNNGPLNYSIQVERIGFHPWATNATAICDANRNDIDLEIHEKLFVPVKVEVRDADNSTVVPAGTTVEVSRFVPEFTGPVDVDGRATTLVSLSGPDNRAVGITVAATAPGYHYNSVFRNLSQDALPAGVTAEVGITRVCSARFVGGSVIDADGRPVPGARVSYAGFAVIADANARFTIDRDVALGGRNNTPVNVVVNASPPNDRPDLVDGFGVKLVDQCAPFEMTVVLGLNPNGPQRFATLQGRFLSPDGTPIAQGRLTINGRVFYGNTDGTYSARLLVGNQNAITGAEPAPQWFFPFAQAGGFDSSGPYDWWPAQFTVQLAANEERTYDIVLQPVRYGTITGVLVDAGTRAPLVGQVLDLSTSAGVFAQVTSGADGRFEAGRLRQQAGGATTGSASSRENGTYWPGRASAPFAGDPAAVDLVVPAVRKCAPSTVTGLVVENTPPNPPLSGVTVQLDTGEQALTGADGRFTLNAGPYYENAPREVTITASKAGFVTASRRVFIFCGATLVVDFAPQSPTTGTITGLVTDSSGTPLPGVFVGTEYGGGTRTGTDGPDIGRYTLTGAPPNPDGSARTWKVSAVPADDSGLLPATVSVAVTGGQTSTADLQLQARDTLPVNRPPVAVITPNGATIPEGSRVDLSASSSSDPDGDPVTFSWDLDSDGSVDGTAATFPLQLGTPGPRTVKLTVFDGKGAATSTQVTVTFTNVAPTVVAGADQTVGPDGVFVRSARFEDPGSGDEFSATVDWGDGKGFVPLPRFARTLDLAHTFPGLGAHPVRVRVCDAANACGEGAFTVTVSSTPPNKEPVALLDGPARVTEGSTVTFDASASSDPEGQALTFAWDLDADGQLDDGSGPTVTFTPTVAGTQTVVVAVTDPAGATAVASAVLTVVGAAPTIDAIADQTVRTGVSLSVSAVVRDTTVAPAGYRATVDWGDGTGPRGAAFVAAGAPLGAEMLTASAVGLADVGRVPLNHTYAVDGRYTVVVTVCDSACTELRFLVTVTAATTAPSVVELPATGSTPMPILRLGLVWLGLGVAFMAVSRRRRTC